MKRQITTADHGTERVRGSFGLNVFYAADSLLSSNFEGEVPAFNQDFLRANRSFYHREAKHAPADDLAVLMIDQIGKNCAIEG